MGVAPGRGATPEAFAAVEAVAAAVGDDGPAVPIPTGPVGDDLRERARAAVEALGRRPGPQDLGPVYEELLSAEARGLGAHFTDPRLARALVDRAAPAGWLGAGPRRVWDPSCGGGAFLLAAADALVAAGHAPRSIATELLHGTDLDPGVVEVCRAALTWWARQHGVVGEVEVRLEVGDTLLEDAAGGGAPFDLVVGNPPFQGQLVGATVRDRSVSDALRDRWGPVAAAYTDTASLFLVAGVRALAPGGRLCMVLPLSTLAARDAAPARRAVEEAADLTGLWVAVDPVFAAEVEVCAAILRRRATGDDRAAPVRRWRGRGVDPIADPVRTGTRGRGPTGRRTSEHLAADGDGTWAVHALAALGVPDPVVRSGGRLDEVVRTSAGFRDEYYGLVGHVAEAPASLGELGPDHDRWPDHLAALVTSGAIDVGRTSWGARPVRFAGDRFERPVVDRRRPPDATRAAAWLRTTAVPKVVVATQTRVGEAAVDERGHLLPSTPVVAAFAPVDRLWEVAAVVCSPVGSVAALARTAGTGRSAHAVRHSAGSVGALPLPVDRDAWSAGAEALRTQDLDGFVAAMAEAYDVAVDDRDHLAAWWHASAPKGRG